MGTIITLISGFTAAFLHVISGPDHLAAVSPLVTERDKKHWRTGLFWGLGHLLGMLLIGLVVYWFKPSFHVEKFSEMSERLVGLILIGVGLWALYRIYKPGKSTVAVHEHKVNDQRVVHVHAEAQPGHEHTRLYYQNEISAMGIGVIHGFAGVSHFLLMLPVLGLESRLETVSYLSGFGLGTVAAMSFFASVLGKFREMAGEKSRWLRLLRISMALLAVGIGVYWIWR